MSNSIEVNVKIILQKPKQMNIPDVPVCACTNNGLLGQVDRVRATCLKIDPLFHHSVFIE
jgi:hypothetical protein